MGKSLVRCPTCGTSLIRGLLDDTDHITLVCATCDRKIGTAGPPSSHLVSEATANVVLAKFDQLAKLKR